jgi:hypothetical protein
MGIVPDQILVLTKTLPLQSALLLSCSSRPLWLAVHALSSRSFEMWRTD